MKVQGVSYVVSWVSNPDACMKCLALNGKTWNVDELEAVPLIYALFTHPHCKCETDIEIEVDPTELQVW